MIIFCWIALVLLTIVCICLLNMIDVCPTCKKKIDSSISICPYCDTNIGDSSIDLDKPTATISGATFETYESVSISPAFNELSNSLNDEDDMKTKSELLQSKDFLNERRLSLFIKWGYLKKNSENNYSLTDLGKKVYRRNHELMEESNG